jgi:alkylation response protein AidB-like acyl-CoA dehydrogenase
MYSFDPTDEQKLIIQTARDFAAKHIRPYAHDSDEKSDLPEGFLAASWELGLATGAIPESLGGAGIPRSAVTGALLVEELACGDLPLAMAMLVPALVAYPLVDYGSELQKGQILPLLTATSFPRVTAALVEPSMNYDAADLATHAESAGGQYVISGHKCLVPLGTAAETFLIYAAEGGAGLDNVQAFIVPRGARGLTVGEKEKNMGLRAVDSVELVLDSVHVPPSSRLGETKGIDFARVMSYSRVAIAAMGVGLARAAYDYAREYAKERKAFGEPIASRQAIAFMLAEMAVEIDAARLLVWEAAWQLDKGKTATEETYLARMYSDAMALKVTDNAVQVLGGHGYIRDNPVEAWLRHARGLSTFDGMATV